MAEENTNGGAGAQPAPPAGDAQPTAQAQPSLKIVTQYVKDLSFENPQAPQVLLNRGAQPKINISVGVQANPVSGNDVEVELKLDTRAQDGDTVVFAIELVYAGIFRLANIPKENVQALTLIECPRLIFPFARQVVAEASRNGGFPPLLIDPIDFVALYRQQMAAAQGGQAAPVANA